jgi:hypothetical protein
MEPKPIQQVDEPLPMAEEESAAAPSMNSAVISESIVEAAPQGDKADELSSSGEPAIPSAFQPKKNTNLIAMPEPSPRLAEVTPIRQPVVDMTGFPFLAGQGLNGPLAPVEPIQPVEPNQ